MPHDDLDELVALLARSRRLLEQYIVDEEDHMRDDMAELCMAIDNALPEPSRVTIKAPAQLERADSEVAAA